MKDIIVYGSDCTNCHNTKELIRQVAEALGVAADIREVTDTVEIMRAGVMSTPGVAVNGEVVHAGGVPTREAIEGWLKG
ncbi:MAG TPA: thioredoxin family protein [Thermopetrobacter sp.]|nr:thioredoxin family protein [Thermopetrobacter sp.]